MNEHRPRRRKDRIAEWVIGALSALICVLLLLDYIRWLL